MKHTQGGKNKHHAADMDPADIVAAVRKAGTSLRQLSVDNGYNPHALKDVLRRHWPKGEAIVAAVIGSTPAEVWPSRYQNKTGRQRYEVSVRRVPA